MGRARLGGGHAALLRARGAPAPRRRPHRRGARQRHARRRPLGSASLLRLPDPGRHRAPRGAVRAGRERGQARRGPAGRASGKLGLGDHGGPRDVVRRALPDPRPAPRVHRAHVRAAPRARPPGRPAARRASRRDRARGGPRLEPRPPHPQAGRRGADDPRAWRGRVRRRGTGRRRSRHLSGRHRAAQRRGRPAQRRAALPPCLRRRADRDGADRSRGPLAAAQPLDRADVRPHRVRDAGRHAGVVQPPGRRRAGPPADPRAARRPAPQLRAGEALRARRRTRAPRPRARLADARRRRAPPVLPGPAGGPQRASPRRGRAARRRAAHAGRDRQRARADLRQGHRASLRPCQPPLGGAQRRQRQRRDRPHQHRGAAPLAPGGDGGPRPRGPAHRPQPRGAHRRPGARRRAGARVHPRQVPAVRRRGPDQRRLHDRDGHLRSAPLRAPAPGARAAPRPGAAAGERRPARRRRRPRLQQPAVGDPDLRRLRTPGARRGASDLRRRRRDQAARPTAPPR